MKMLRVDVDAEVGEMGRGLGKAVPKPVPFEKPKRQPEGLPKGIVVNEKGQWGYDPGKVLFVGEPQGAMASSAALEEAPPRPLQVGDWVRRKDKHDKNYGGLLGYEVGQVVSAECKSVWADVRLSTGETWGCILETLELSPWQFAEQVWAAAP